MRVPSSANLALLVGALGSGAAQVAWNWPHGPVRMAAGLFATALVPAAIHLWPRVPVTGWITRGLRALVMGYICAAAAIVNLAHATMLLAHWDNPAAEHTILAVLLVTAIEATMVMASLARRQPAEPKPAAATVGDAVQQAALMQAVALAMRAQPVQVSAAPRASRPQRRAGSSEPRRRVTTRAAGTSKLPPRDWAEKQIAEGNPAPSGAEIMLATGTKKAHAYRIAKQLRESPVVAS